MTSSAGIVWLMLFFAPLLVALLRDELANDVGREVLADGMRLLTAIDARYGPAPAADPLAPRHASS